MSELTGRRRRLEHAREPQGRGAAWTLFVPSDPPRGRGTSDEGRRRLESAPEASGQG